MNKIVQYIASWVLVMLFIVGILVWELRQMKTQNHSYWSNLEAIRQQTDSIKTMQGETAYQTIVMQFKMEELKKLYPDLMQEIKNLKLKPNRVESYSATAFESNKIVHTNLKDSILFDSTKVKVLNYKDEYFCINGVLNGDNQEFKIKYQDTLIQVVFYGEREKPWLWILSRRKLQQRILLKNPDSKINYPIFIKIQK